MILFVENSRQCKVIYSDRLVTPRGMRRAGRNRDCKGFWETSVGDRSVLPSHVYGDGFVGTLKMADFMKLYILNRCHLLYVSCPQSVKNSQYIHKFFPKSALKQRFPPQNFLQCSFWALPLPAAETGAQLEELWSATNKTTPNPCLLPIQAPVPFQVPPAQPASRLMGKGKAGPSSLLLPLSDCPSQCVAPTALPSSSAVPNQPLEDLQWGPTPSPTQGPSLTFLSEEAPPGSSLIPQSPNPAPSVSHFWASPLCSLQRD